jgi:hypothetical protein
MTSWTVLTLILNARTATSESVLSIGWGVVQNRQATCETALVTKFCSLSYSSQVTQKANGGDAESGGASKWILSIESERICHGIATEQVKPTPATLRHPSWYETS